MPAECISFTLSLFVFFGFHLFIFAPAGSSFFYLTIVLLMTSSLMMWSLHEILKVDQRTFVGVVRLTGAAHCRDGLLI